MAIGTLTMKATRHETTSTRKPQRTCPSTAAMPANAAQVPTAAPLPLECCAKDGQRAGDQGGGTEGLNRPRGNQLVYGGRKCATHAGQREDQDTEDEDPTVAEAVAKGAANQDQGGQQQCVSLHHPLGLREGGPEIVLDRGQSHVGH